MNIFIRIYIILWIILILIGLVLLIKNRKEVLLFRKKYINFLFVRWKLILFFLAVISLSIMSTLGLDPTWDIPETIVMSILTFYTAPYSSGIIYRYLRGLNKNSYEFYIAIILLFFSSAWFYDLYTLLFLLGEYPPMAFSNLLLSPFFYLFGGITWNFGYSKKKGVIFLFKEKDWIDTKTEKDGFDKIFLYILPIIIFMIVIFGGFLYLNM